MAQCFSDGTLGASWMNDNVPSDCMLNVSGVRNEYFESPCLAFLKMSISEKCEISLCLAFLNIGGRFQPFDLITEAGNGAKPTVC